MCAAFVCTCSSALIVQVQLHTPLTDDHDADMNTLCCFLIAGMALSVWQLVDPDMYTCTGA